MCCLKKALQVTTKLKSRHLVCKVIVLEHMTVVQLPLHYSAVIIIMSESKIAQISFTHKYLCLIHWTDVLVF